MDQFVPEKGLITIDLKDQLWQGLALREKDFRTFVKEHDWSRYSDSAVAVFCSADAIIPHWAYMLVATNLKAHTDEVYFANPEEAEEIRVKSAIDSFDLSAFEDAKVIVKGCGEGNLSYRAYGHIANRLAPMVSSLMFGEPCSTVPVYKRPRKK